MPRPGYRWRHVVISTVNSWLPGDPRGFRAEDHKIHSSGDYKNPPPPGEQEGLLRYSHAIRGDPVVIPRGGRKKVGEAILKRIRKLKLRVLAIAVAGMHAHALVELPDEKAKMKTIVGGLKAVSSHAIRDMLPGRVWGGGGKLKRVDTAQYQRRVYRYILHQKDAWIWSF